MKLTGRDATRYFTAPDLSAAGALLYGQDATRVALKRADVVNALLGPNGEEELRLTRIAAADLRKDSASLSDAIKSAGFFPGARVVLVEGATDGLTKTIAAALAEWKPGDAQIIATAGGLNTRSSLRKAFEAHKSAFAIGIYNDPVSRAEVEAILAKAGLATPAPDALNDLAALAQVMDPGDFAQTVEKLALYKRNDATPLSSNDVANCAPATTEADLDDILHSVSEARVSDIGGLMQRLSGQGVQPVGLCIGAMRHFRTLHAAASDPGGPASGIGKARPPVFGPRRDRMVRQAQNWGVPKLESAISILVDTDLQLRSAAQRAPQLSLVERALIRLAMLGAARR